MKRAVTIVAAVALAVFIGGAALAQMGPGARGPMGPGSEQAAKMMDMLAQMQEQMQQMMKKLCPGAMGAPAPKPGG